MEIKCNNNKCDFWNCGNCIYGGTAEITTNPLTEKDCKAHEPCCEEEN